MSAVHLFHLPIDMAQVPLLAFEELLGALDDHRDQSHGHRKDQEGDHRHQRANTEHHDQHSDDRRHRGDYLCRALVQAHAQGIHVIGDA